MLARNILELVEIIIENHRFELCAQILFHEAPMAKAHDAQMASDQKSAFQSYKYCVDCQDIYCIQGHNMKGATKEVARHKAAPPLCAIDF